MTEKPTYNKLVQCVQELAQESSKRAEADQKNLNWES